MTKTTKRKPGREPAGALVSLLALAALGAFVLAGCGASSGGSSEVATDASATTGSAGAGEAGESTGGSETGESSAGAAGGPGGFAISEEAQKCLKEQGVELPEFKAGTGGPPNGEAPGGGELPEGGEPPAGAPSVGEAPAGGAPPGGTANAKKMQRAFKACGVEMQGGPGGAAGQNSAAFKAQVREYVACVRENGYELPEPNLSGEGPVFDESKVDQEDPEFKKASAKCQGLLGGAGGASESGGT